MKIPPYYSAKEAPKQDRVYHTHDNCQSGRDILEKVKGKPAGYKLCSHCKAKG